jgi:hypothetical protein
MVKEEGLSAVDEARVVLLLVAASLHECAPHVFGVN